MGRGNAAVFFDDTEHLVKHVESTVKLIPGDVERRLDLDQVSEAGVATEPNSTPCSTPRR